MAGASFLIYGAYGYTGELIARQAVARGHRPVLAGRDRQKLQALASELGLPSLVLGLEDRAALIRALEPVDAVCHAAGPFVHTSGPLVEACLAAHTSYLDITGELPVFDALFQHHTQAQRQGVALISGVGFDVVPTDCLARFVADRVEGASQLEIAFAVLGRPSAGTAKSSFEGLLRGNFVRRGGKLQAIPLGEGIKEVQFSDRRRYVLPIPWGDLETAFRTTGIPDITTYMAVPATPARLLARALPLTSRLLPSLARQLARPFPRRAILAAIETHVSGPDESARQSGRAYLWARAAAPDGRAREAWLETADGYAFTAESAVLSLERLAELRPTGALTPAQAFGADFVLSVSGSVRHEQLPVSARTASVP
jgi:short subunit dehydrogenase-like uncharacterized protein